MSPKRKNEKIVEIVVLSPWQASEVVENFLLESGALGTSIDSVDLEFSAERVHGYFPEDTEIDELEAAVGAYLNAIRDYIPTPERWEYSSRILPDKDWQDAWKTFYKTIRVTHRIIVRPTWESYRGRRGETVIEIDPGMAFGTGLHATTRLCLEAIDEEIKRRIGATQEPRVSLLDVGTGSGILAIAAAKLGARPVIGIDIDETAIEVARQNAKKNGVQEAVRISLKALTAVDDRFDLVVANIDYRTLTEFKGLLISHVSERGRLILSGIIGEDRERLREIFEQGGCQIVGEKQRERWTCLIYEQSRGCHEDSAMRDQGPVS
jgi:ribosomal protein L11 methyltransferase